MAIVKLDRIVASRIAAGEVVDRPASIVRELMDNSIDAQASKITVSLQEGGIRSICVTDNGKGISKEDIPMAFENHATSKIRTIEDLFNLHTLGFRGEALPSIASCSRLTVSSNGYKVICDNGIKSQLLPGAVTEGTAVLSENLFENIPARKQFLKRPSAEFNECKKVFLEKALGFENIEFILISDGNLMIDLKSTDKKQRVLDIMSLDGSFVRADSLSMSESEDPVKLFAVCSSPAQYKKDRSQVKIFLNGRIIDCFAMVQVIVNAYSVALPGGAFPYFYLFIEDSPSLIDFNIHPAKRECKIRNQNSIYAPLTRMIRNALVPQKKHNESFQYKPSPAEHKEKHVSDNSFSTVSFDPKWFENAKTVLKKDTQKPQIKTDVSSIPSYRYLGQVFNTFLVVEKNNEILFIDQHALHERLLYDEITECKDRQILALPYRFETDISVDDFLVENSFIYSDLGVTLVRVQPMVWEITEIPAQCRKNEEEIVSFIRTATGDVEEAKKGLFAVIACHAAIKAGDVVDDITAKSLLNKCFQLDAMLCPHGRSFTYSVSKEKLFELVGRSI